jgi:fructose-bisphosphate aldolase class II
MDVIYIQSVARQIESCGSKVIRSIGIFGMNREMKVRAGSTKTDFGIANPLAGGKLLVMKQPDILIAEGKLRTPKKGSTMKQLLEIYQEAEKKGVAVGHFNVSDLTALMGVVAAAKELSVPVVIGASEGERKFLGDRQLSALVKSYRDETGLPIFLNADHTHSLESAVAAVKAGFDSVVFDLSALPFEENIRKTKEAIDVLKKINPAVLIEGEIGDIGTGSQIHESIPDLSKGLTTAEEARKFVESTGVDILAPAVGNMHGMVASMIQGKEKKHLDLARISQIKEATGSFLTLHGASGTNDDDLRRCIKAGITVIHINTELRVAWRESLEQSLAEHKQEVVPYKILPAVIDAIRQVASSRLKLFNNL